MIMHKPQKDNICAITVTYHPDSNFPARLNLLLKQVAFTVIIDNNSSFEIREILQNLAQNNQLALVLNNANLGIATALNQGISWAQQHGYHWVLALDQDSLVEEFMVDRLIDTFEKLDNKDKVVMVGSNHRAVHNDQLHFRPQKNINCPWIERKSVITSGTLICVDLFYHIGPFREEFFIDVVDHEFCLRARKKGYKVMLVLQPLLKHSMGNRQVYVFPFLPKVKITTANYSPFRKYYSVRNNIILIFEYLLFDPAWVLHCIIHLCESIVVMLLFEEQRVKKSCWVLIGLWDGLRKNTKRKVIDDSER